MPEIESMNFAILSIINLINKMSRLPTFDVKRSLKYILQNMVIWIFDEFKGGAQAH